jgi:hypothetical protein
MAISYYMVQMPPLLLFVLIISFGSIFTGLSTFLFRKYIRVKMVRSHNHNEVTGFFFTAISGFYALLLGFVVFVVWDQLNETQNNASREGSSALGLYRDIRFYPDTVESKELMAVYLNFVFDVINEEIPNMSRMQPSIKTPESLNSVFYKMERLNPKNPFQVQLVAEMFTHLNELSIYRGLRTSSIETEIPSPVWLPIILGAFITFACALLVDIEHTRIHVLLNTLLGAFIGMLFFIIILFNHPFKGSMAIEPTSYMEIFTVNELHFKK